MRRKTQQRDKVERKGDNKEEGAGGRIDLLRCCYIYLVVHKIAKPHAPPPFPHKRSALLFHGHLVMWHSLHVKETPCSMAFFPHKRNTLFHGHVKKVYKFGQRPLIL